MDHIEILKSIADITYKEFNSSLIPTLPRDNFIGVRTPELRKISRIMEASFLLMLPHTYFEEDQIHAFMVSEMADFDGCISELERFLPYINNWATCDQLSPKVFLKNKDKLIPYISDWICSEHVYTVRFAINMLMKHFLSSDFDPVYPKMIKAISSDDYYVKMAVSWYYATALSTNWNEVIPYLSEYCLNKWVHNKTIRKAIESRRITEEQKAYLKTLVI